MKTVNPGIKVTDTCWTNMAQMLVGQITKASYSAHNDFEATIACKDIGAWVSTELTVVISH